MSAQVYAHVYMCVCVCVCMCVCVCVGGGCCCCCCCFLKLLFTNPTGKINNYVDKNKQVLSRGCTGQQ